MSIHIIDDEVIFAELVSEMLELEGYTTTTFSSAEAYLEHMRTPDYLAPQIVISDVIMPGMSGLELIKEIRNSLPAVKIIAISGFHDHLITATDVDAALAKPFDFEQLHQIVASLHPSPCNATA